MSESIELLVLLKYLGVSDEGIGKLLRLRRAYRGKRLEYDGLDMRRLEFARWLYLSGKISG